MLAGFPFGRSIAARGKNDAKRGGCRVEEVLDHAAWLLTEGSEADNCKNPDRRRTHFWAEDFCSLKEIPVRSSTVPVASQSWVTEVCSSDSALISRLLAS